LVDAMGAGDDPAAFASDFRLTLVGGLFLFEKSLRPPVTKLPHRPKFTKTP
jgi:hypothetical protein